MSVFLISDWNGTKGGESTELVRSLRINAIEAALLSLSLGGWMGSYPVGAQLGPIPRIVVSFTAAQATRPLARE
jgi:hypothetical protein